MESPSLKEKEDKQDHAPQELQPRSGVRSRCSSWAAYISSIAANNCQNEPLVQVTIVIRDTKKIVVDTIKGVELGAVGSRELCRVSSQLNLIVNTLTLSVTSV